MNPTKTPTSAPKGEQGITSRTADRTPAPKGGRRPNKKSDTESIQEILGSIGNFIQILDSGFIDLDAVELDNPRQAACDLYAATNKLRKLAHRIEGTS